MTVSGQRNDQRRRTPDSAGHAFPASAATRLIIGDRDPIGSSALLDGWQEYADDMRVDIVDGAGHFLPDEVPERVVAEVLERFA